MNVLCCAGELPECTAGWIDAGDVATIPQLDPTWIYL